MSNLLRFFNQADGNFFLFGPRGTGKSTWLHEQYPLAAWIDLLDSEIKRNFLAHPERLRDFVAANMEKRVFVIDEIQNVPELLPMVHQQIEANKDLQFILTGSSARKLKKAGVDLLGGRAIVRTMHPFMASEMGDRFELAQSLQLGMVPLVRMSAEPEKTLRSYIGMYIEQEVKTEGLVRRLDDFARFLEAITFSHAQVLNVASIARECGTTRNTVESYITILEDLLIAVRIPVFSKRAKRALISHAKLYFFDCGVYRALRPAGPLDSREEIGGQSLEGLVFQHLRAWIDYREADLRIYFWRTIAGNEVDFVLYGNDGMYAIEVKSGAAVRAEDLRGLKSFGQDYPEARQALLYRGKERINKEGVLCIPIEEFLCRISPERGILEAG